MLLLYGGNAAGDQPAASNRPSYQQRRRHDQAGRVEEDQLALSRSRHSAVTTNAISSASPATASIAHAAMPRLGAIPTSEAPVQSAPPHQKNDSAIQLTGEPID